MILYFKHIIHIDDFPLNVLPEAVFKSFYISLILDELHVIVESSAYMNNIHSRGVDDRSTNGLRVTPPI